MCIKFTIFEFRLVFFRHKQGSTNKHLSLHDVLTSQGQKACTNTSYDQIGHGKIIVKLNSLFATMSARFHESQLRNSKDRLQLLWQSINMWFWHRCIKLDLKYDRVKDKFTKMLHLSWINVCQHTSN
jgi:hypothetical protein